MTRKKSEPKTSYRLKYEGGLGLRYPERLSNEQVQSLAGSVEAHIEPRRTRTKSRHGRCATKRPSLRR